MACAEPCLDGCDLACETRATWKPDPRRQHSGISRPLRAFSTRFVPNGKGGGFVQIATLSSAGHLGIWKTAARKRPMEA